MGYFTKRYHPPGTPPGTLVEHAVKKQTPLRIRLIDYNDREFVDMDLATVEDCQPYLSRSSITWIHFHGHVNPDILSEIGTLLSLHPLAMEDVLNAGQRPKIDEYDEHLFIALVLPLGLNENGSAEQVSLFVNENYVVSFHASEHDPFDPLRNRLHRRTGRIRTKRVDYLLYSILDLVIDQGFPVLEHFGERIEEIEEELLNSPNKNTLSKIHEVRRELFLVRRLLWPHREVLNHLLQGDRELVRDDTRIYFRDCYDHTIQIMDLVENYRDMTGSMLEVYLSSISHRLNEIMRVLTLIATIFIPLTFIVGIYGMNFGINTASPWAMPELNWYYGYPTIWVIMIGVVGGMLIYFRKKNWF